MAIYLGNESDQELTLEAMELCGFNTGEYQQKAIAGGRCLWEVCRVCYSTVVVVALPLARWRHGRIGAVRRLLQVWVGFITGGVPKEAVLAC